LVKSLSDLAPTLKEAFHLARSGRPGPVLVDIPKNVANGRIAYRPPGESRIRPYTAVPQPHAKQLRTVAKLIREARRPLIFAGGGVILAGGSEELTRLARRARMPVTTSLMGLGAFPGDDPLFLGMIGMHGTYASNMSTGACDLMLAVGVRFDDRVTGKTDAFAAQAAIVHIDIDPTSIRKNVPVSVPVVGDCRISLQRLNELIADAQMQEMASQRQEWLGRVAEWKTSQPLSYRQGATIKPQYVVEQVHALTRGEAIITTEVGQNQMWAAQFYRFNRPNHFITSGGLGTMGFGLPAAIGAQIACPDKTVVDIAGDGSIQMNIQEMATAVQYGLPVKIVILNNGYLGMVRQWQELFYGGRYSATRMSCVPDFVKLAEAYGAVGLRATRPDEVAPVLKEGLAVRRPVIMDFVVEAEESVYPMVPSGAPLTEMLLV
jgi:acetolactate synthase-1/2/3 large subunit